MVTYKKIIASLGLSVVASLLIAAPAFAAAFSNGSFESSPIDPGSFTTLNAGDTTNLPGWKVTIGSVDYIGTYWQPVDGNRSLDMSGNAAGAISQTFDTVKGHSYTVTFSMAGNPDGSPNIKTMDVDTGGLPSHYSFDDSGFDKTNMGWKTETYSFTASSSNTVLTFTSTTDGFYGPALDNVKVSVNPPTKESQCDKGGWKEFTDPSFKNEEQCEKFVKAEAEGHLKMSGPSQEIIFNAWNNPNSQDKDDHGKSNMIEYWNYDYPPEGGTLHYSAAVTCAFVNPATKDARMMWQIPVGHPGLSDLYVVAYVKRVKNGPDLYGHAATADQTTAMQWCQTGAGFSPIMYPVTSGHVKIESEK